MNSLLIRPIAFIDSYWLNGISSSLLNHTDLTHTILAFIFKPTITRFRLIVFCFIPTYKSMKELILKLDLTDYKLAAGLFINP